MKRGVWTAPAGSGYARKPRPAVIVRDDRFDTTASVTVLAFTTDPADAPLLRLLVEADKVTGIRKFSRLMVDEVTTVPRSKRGDHRRGGACVDPQRVRSGDYQGWAARSSAARGSSVVSSSSSS